MLRERIDISILEDFVSGLGRTGGVRVGVYDRGGALITLSPPRSSFALLSSETLEALPRNMAMTPLKADEPPASVAFVEHAGVWHVVAPVHVYERLAGFVTVGDLRDPRVETPPAPGNGAAHVDLEQWTRAWLALPPLERTGDARPVTAARWAARMLSDWCRHEEQLNSATDELALLSDIGGLISGETDLQKMLDHIVAETARVMRCRYASLRLFDERSGELRIAAVYNLSRDYVSRGAVLRSDNPIDDEALGGGLVYIEDAQRDPRVRFPEVARRLGIVSGLTAGMIHQGRPVGVLRIYADHKRRFRAPHRHLLRAVAAQAAMAIVNAGLIEERLRSAEMERQLALAGDLQARMMRTRQPPHPAIESAMVFDPSSHVGGDFCDLLGLRDGRLAAAVGDVVGHGVPASLLMASVRGALRACAELCDTPCDILARLNSHVFRETLSSEFVTLLLVAIDPAGRNLSYCNAGHEPPMLLRRGKVLEPQDGGLVLGMSTDEKYGEHPLELESGDFLLLYTDGAVEAMNFAGQLYGRERLRESLLQYGGQSPSQALRSIHWDIRRFVGMAEQSDDLTMVGLRVVR